MHDIGRVSGKATLAATHLGKMSASGLDEMLRKAHSVRVSSML